MGIRYESRKDFILHLLENWLIFLILLVFSSYSILNFIFGEMQLVLYSENYHYFIETTVGNALHNLKSSLLSIATIFIGIYVTVFTLLGSIKVDSIFAFLNEYTFKKLIIFIRNAFIASFSYLILIMVMEIIYSDIKQVHFIIIVINIGIVLYMFLTALRFGIILYNSFRKDLSNLQKNINKHREEKREIESLQYRIDNFLKDYEETKKKQSSDKMSKIISQDKEED